MFKHQKIAFTTTLICNVIIALFSFSVASAAENISATAKLDSTTMIMGSKTALHVEFVGEFGDDAHTYINQEEWKNVEINQTDSSDMSVLGNNRRELRAMFMIQAFDSGLFTLPPVYLISGNDTIASNTSVLKVDPIALDTANVIFKDGQPVDIKVHDLTDVVNAEEKLLDMIPDWVTITWPWILLAIALLSLIIFVYLKWLRHGKIPLIPTKKPVPPYVLAIEKLNALQQKKLWQHGAEKEYYTQLTDILRGYLYGRFGINAMEMTTPQILAKISDTDEAKEFASFVHSVLKEADFVKFAKAKPAAPENELAFRNVREFVELTKPIEKPEEKDSQVSKDNDSEENKLNNTSK